MAKMTNLEQFKNLLPKNGEIADEEVLSRAPLKLKEEIDALNKEVTEGAIEYKRYVVSTNEPNKVTPIKELRIDGMTKTPSMLSVNGVNLDTVQYYYRDGKLVLDNVYVVHGDVITYY